MSPEEKRKKRNKELLERMNDPTDPLTSHDATDTFFPPRPLVKKDLGEVKKIFGDIKDGDKG